MTLCEIHKKEEEIRKNQIWKSLSPYMKHMVLMYAYRIHTDFNNIELYVEAFRFRGSGLCFTDMPDFIRTSSPEQLYDEAYTVLGMPTPKRETA